MNNTTTLDALQQGFVTKSSDVKPQAELVAAVATAQSPAQVTQIGPPVQFSTINAQSLVSKNDSVIEFQFHNGTGAPQNVYFSTLLGQPGSAESFNQPPSAVDFATFTELNSVSPANCGILKGFNLRAQFMPVVINNVTIQTTDLAQSNKRLFVGYITKNLTMMENGIVPSLCDACFNNNDNAYTKEFRGPFVVGKSTYLKYVVNNNVDVYFRIEIAGESNVANFTPEG